MASDPSTSGTQPAPLKLQSWLDRSVYIARFEACQTSLQRSALVLVALVAFWLAIENGYDRFELRRKAFQDAVSAEILVRRANDLKVRRSNEVFKLEQRSKDTSASEQLIAIPMGSLEAELDDRRKELVEAREAFAKAKANEKSAREEFRNMTREPVMLRVAGTDLPSQLRYSPILWLSVLLAWLFFFDSRRAGAHRNLSAALASDTGTAPTFGAAGDGTAWVAPLPARLTLISGESGQHQATAAEMRNLLGWTTTSENRYRIHLAVMAAVFAMLTLRVGYVAVDLAAGFSAPVVADQGDNSSTNALIPAAAAAPRAAAAPSAAAPPVPEVGAAPELDAGMVDQGLGYAPEGWRIPWTILSVLLTASCFALLVRIPLRSDGSDVLVVGRRETVGELAGVGLLALLMAWPRFQSSAGAAKAGSKAPRYIPKKDRAARRAKSVRGARARIPGRAPSSRHAPRERRKGELAK